MTAVRRKILVVEDDEETLNVLSRTLAAGGYDVLWARNASDALRLLTRPGHRVRLMITDVVLPGTSGAELVKHVRGLGDDVLAIYVSAYDLETVRSHGVDPVTVPFLAKPMEPGDLLRLVDEAFAS